MPERVEPEPLDQFAVISTRVHSLTDVALVSQLGKVCVLL